MRRGRGGAGGKNGLLPNSLRIISSCLKTVSANAGSVASTVRSAGASVAASISAAAEDEKDQVLWAGFDKLELELGSSSFKHVLLLGYSNGFQVLDVEDASNVCELVSKRDGPVTFLQMQPTPLKSEGGEGFRTFHPMLLVVAGDETNGLGMVQGGRLSALIRETTNEPQPGSCISTPTVVRFFSLKSHNYVHVLRFRSAVYMIRCSPRIVAIALAAQIYCFDAVTLENKFSVLTYPLQGAVGVNIGYGPMAVGPRWLAYASNNPLMSNLGRLSPQNLTPSPGVSPSTSPGNGSLVARYAVESSKQLAAGILNLSDMGYKTLSKYCQELLPDGSSSPMSSGRKIGRLQSNTHPSEADNAGMVVVKDFVSKEVVSQFRAHTSPISALCFDPSGTLLVTASVHGHNINVFRIMPTIIANSSSPVRYDWTTSHVHLYKLYRGITTAVIEDICFSHYSQWVAIVSSRGTCHIFVLSPFGGDSSLLPQTRNCDGPALVPSLTSPWWSTSSCSMDQQLIQPPAPITLSVVSRIKNGYSGWLNTVSNVAASATGKILIPSGAMAAVFHNSMKKDNLPSPLKRDALEHLLVYSPSGHLIQHELLPSLGAQSWDSGSKTGASPLLQHQDEELHVIVEPVQWWDVCRRSNWPERDENISRVNKHLSAEFVMDISDCEDNDSSLLMSSNGIAAEKEFERADERHHWFLSNAEVHVNSGRIPIWQKPRICFYKMISSKGNGGSNIGCAGDELEIENLLIAEVEIRQKDLLPVFEQLHTAYPEWSDRSLPGQRHQSSSSMTTTSRNNTNVDLRPALPEPASDSGSHRDGSLQLGSAESSSLMPPSRIGNRYVGTMPSVTQANASIRMPMRYSHEDCAPFDYTHCSSESPMGSSVVHGLSNSGSNLSSVSVPATKESLSSNNSGSSEITDSCISNFNVQQTEMSESLNSGQFAPYFNEGYCKVSELDDCRELTEVVTDVDSSSSHCERDKPEEDGDNDDMLGGVFVFSEEG
ncbi:putative transcription factor WD40-like family [Dioscorea sansibarensis]